jgi:hypothetical protein
LLEDLHVYHINYFLVLRCLHNFTSSLPKYPLGRQVSKMSSLGVNKVRIIVLSCFDFSIAQASDFEMKPALTVRTIHSSCSRY